MGLHSLEGRVGSSHLRNAALVVATFALMFAALAPIGQARGIELASGAAPEPADPVSGGAYVVQVEEGSAVSDVLADSEAVDVGETEELSGEAFNGAVADIDRDQARQLRENPSVVSVERNKIVTADADGGRRLLARPKSVAGPSEDYSAQALTPVWGLDRTDQRHLPLDSDYSPPASGSGVHVYVIDNGVDLDHPDFEGRVGKSWYLPELGEMPAVCNGHGTHVAGTIASKTYGMAKKATVHSVRALNCNSVGTVAGIVAGLNWVAENAGAKSVVNMSLGVSTSTAINSAVANVVAKGVPVVASAGNNRFSACDKSPASAPQAITVGSLNRLDNESEFSNYGPCVDVYGPGEAVESLMMGDPGGPWKKSGTSMAAAHVTGTVAVLWSDRPSLNGNQIDDYVLGEATPGVVNFRSTGQRGSPNLNVHVEPVDATPPVIPPPPSDTTAPNTRITSGTSGRVNSRNAKFSFTSTEAGSTFQCKLDGGSWKRCTSPHPYTGLVNGSHTFRVRATDKAGNIDASPAVRKFTTARRARVSLKARNNRSKLLVDVNPNNASKNYRIKVQKKIKGKWRTVRTTSTKRAADRRKINMGKGRYRITVPAQLGLLRAKSASVRLKR